MSLIIGIFCFQGEVKASEFNFSVDLEIPDNQIDKEKTYLDLLMEPDQTQKIPYTLYNDTDQDVTVEVLIHSATTNSNGVIEYGESLSEIDDSLTYDMAEIVSTPDEVVIPAKGSITEELEIQAPAKEFAGVIAGGITFQEKQEDTVDTSQTVGVVNRFSQVKAILIQTSEKEVTPDFVLKKAYPDQSNVRNVIAVNLQNPQAAYMFDVQTTINIYKKGEDKAYLTLEKEGINIAPNTNFSLNVPLEGQKLEAGKYEAVVDASWQEETWNLKTEFEISGDKAKELNDKDIDLQSEPDNQYLWWIIGALVVVIVVLIILFILKERRKKK
jgi:hypothetical protein